MNPPFPLTDAQRLTRGYCGHEQRRSPAEHAESLDGRTDRQTDRLLPR